LLGYKKLEKINFIAETEHDKIVEDLEVLKNIRKKYKNTPLSRSVFINLMFVINQKPTILLYLQMLVNKMRE
jgi:hypothetical protein